LENEDQPWDGSGVHYFQKDTRDMWVWKKQEFRKTSKRLDTRKRAKTHKNGMLVLGIILLHLPILGEEQRENARFCPDPAGFVRTSYDKLHG